MRIVAVLLLTFGTISASAQYYMNIRTKGGTSVQYVVTDIDSVWFTGPAVSIEKPITFAISSRKPIIASNTVSSDKYVGTFAVWSTKRTTDGTSNSPMVLFNGDDINDIITYDEDNMEPNHWTYSPYRYWDNQSSYCFVAVSPNSNIIRFNNPDNVADNSGKYVTTNATGYTLVGQNLQSATSPAEDEIMLGFKGGQGEDTDLMISDKVNINAANGAQGDVNLHFNHILSKLNIAIAKDPVFDNVKVLIKSVKITGLDDTGTYIEPSSYATNDAII